MTTTVTTKKIKTEKFIDPDVFDLSKTIKTNIQTLCTKINENKSTKKMNISFNSLSFNEILDISVAFQGYYYLTELNISNNHLENKGTSILLNCLKKYCIPIRLLNLSRNIIKNFEIAGLSDYIMETKILKTLNISKNNPHLSGMRSFFNSLTINQTIESLDISYNNIGNLSASFISDMIKSNIYLRILSLKGNNFTEKSMHMFINSFSQNPYISIINMKNNSNISFELQDYFGCLLYLNSILKREKVLLFILAREYCQASLLFKEKLPTDIINLLIKHLV